MPDGASFDLGASLGIPFLTAHRCLTLDEFGPRRLRPGALDGRTVLVAGGAGAVVNAAIQLAAAVEAGAVRVGDEAGLPLHRFPLERTAAAHDAVQAGAVGKVLVDVGSVQGVL